MSDTYQAYTLTLSANLIFALCIQVFAHYSRKISPLWMNCFKATVALICFSLAVLLTGGSFDFSFKVISLLVLSGVIGLAIGDFCLLAAFKELGPGRAMVLVSFHPLITGVLSYLFHGQSIEASKLGAVVFMMACMITFSLESFKMKGEWYIGGALLALAGVCLDSLSMILIKEVGLGSQIGDLEGCALRCIGAVAFFLCLNFFKPIKLWTHYKERTTKGKWAIMITSFFGTFVALLLIFRAVRLTKDNLATLASINISCSVFASLFECIHKKEKPSVYLVVAFIFMFAGLFIFLR